MRTFVIVVLLLVPMAAFAGNKYNRYQDEETKEAQSERRDTVNSCVDSIEVIDGKPSRPYAVIAPVREKSSANIILRKSPEKLLATMKKSACRMSANALINLQCGEVQVGKSNYNADYNNAYGSGHGSGYLTSVPACQALAVRWK